MSTERERYDLTPAAEGFYILTEAAIRIKPRFRRLLRVLNKMRADLRKYRKDTTINHRKARRAEVQAARRPALIHKGGKP